MTPEQYVWAGIFLAGAIVVGLLAWVFEAEWLPELNDTEEEQKQ